MSAGHLGRGVVGGVAGEEAGPGAAGQHVVDGPGHLVAGRVDGLGPEVGQAGDQRLAERRVLLDHGQHARGRRRRSGRPGARPRVVAADRDRARSPRRRGAGGAWCGCDADRARRASPRTSTTASTVSAAISR